MVIIVMSILGLTFSHELVLIPIGSFIHGFIFGKRKTFTITYLFHYFHKPWIPGVCSIQFNDLHEGIPVGFELSISRL